MDVVELDKLVSQDDATLDDGDEGAEVVSVQTVVLPFEARGERFDKVLARAFRQYSRSRLQQWIEAGRVTVDEQLAHSRITVLGGETVVVSVEPDPQTQSFSPEAMALTIVFEDESLIVIDKPAGLVVHPAAGNSSGTLLNGLLHHDPALQNVPRAGIVHRLDKETSGLMVVAKTIEAQTYLVRQLQARSVKREYRALVWGQPHLSGTVDKPIARHAHARLKMAVSHAPSAKSAVTHFERLASGKLDDLTVSLMACRLETGRTHQIRVHMQSLGFPLVGDPLYGKTHLAPVFPRQALHAARLGLIHPASGEECPWVAPLPADMASLLVAAGIEWGEEGA